MTQSATKSAAVEEAVHILRAACQSQGCNSASSGSSSVATLLPSAAFLASHCTPALLSSLLDACDATSPESGVPKKLATLNAAWKLLLAVASYDGVTTSDYETALVHMIEQLRWGVLTHDWSDKKRVRLATFFASHLVLAVRAHPRLLLTGTEASQVFLSHLVRLYFAVCVTVATSTRDAEAVATLYDNIVGRLHGIFDCLGGAATAAMAFHSRGKGEEAAQAVWVGSTAVGELLARCVSTSAAAEVQEAAGGGEKVLQATATAGLSAYLHVVHGILKNMSDRTVAEEEIAAACDSSRENTAGKGKQTGKGDAAAGVAEGIGRGAEYTKTLTILTDSFLLWTGHNTSDRSTGNDEEQASARDWQSSCCAGAIIRKNIQTLSRTLPPNLFMPHVLSCDTAVIRNAASFRSGVAAPASLRALWVDALASLWQQWIITCTSVEGSENGKDSSDTARSRQKSDAEENRPTCVSSNGLPQTLNAASGCTQLSSVVLSPVISSEHTSAVALMVLEAWTELFRRLESTAKAATSSSQSSSTQLAVVRTLLHVLAHLRCTATNLAQCLFTLLKLDGCDGDAAAVLETTAGDGEGRGSAAALLMQWICAVVALLSYGQSALGMETAHTFTDDSEGEWAAADELISQLMEVVLAQSTSSSLREGYRREGGEDGAAGGGMSSGAASAELRAALLSLQQESRKVCKRGTFALGSRVHALSRLLLPIPRTLHRLIGSFLASSSCPHRISEDIDEGMDKSIEQLKQCVLSCSSLFAFVTQTLQSLAEVSTEPIDEEGDEEATKEENKRNIESQMHGARVARWVAARLVYEVAAIPLTDSADDAVLLACVRRWTDVAFSATSKASATENPAMSVARRCGDAVVSADAAASLLRMAQECTTLDLEHLNLSEDATVALMGLVDRDSQEGSDTDSDAQWHALQEQDAQQWSLTKEWLQKQGNLGCTEAEERTAIAEPTLADDGEGGLFPMATVGKSSIIADYLRGLEHCEVVLQQLHEIVASGVYEVEGGAQVSKRPRVDRCNEGTGPHAQRTIHASEEDNACITCALARIVELSHVTLTQMGGRAAAPTSPPPPSSSPVSRKGTAGEEICHGRFEEAPRKKTQVLTLSDAESISGSRRPSNTEVIDIE
jgi:hypothetical protein